MSSPLLYPLPPHHENIQIKQSVTPSQEKEKNQRVVSEKKLLSLAALHRKFETNIPRNETARSRSQFLHSCICERFIYYHIGPPIMLYCVCGTIMGIHINHSQIHEFRNWKHGSEVSFLGIFASTFWYSAFTVRWRRKQKMICCTACHGRSSPACIQKQCQLYYCSFSIASWRECIH
jgi:hypothetical protein